MCDTGRIHENANNNYPFKKKGGFFHANFFSLIIPLLALCTERMGPFLRHFANFGVCGGGLKTEFSREKKLVDSPMGGKVYISLFYNHNYLPQ